MMATDNDDVSIMDHDRFHTRISLHQYQYNTSICNYLVASVAIILENRETIYNHGSIIGEIIKLFG